MFPSLKLMGKYSGCSCSHGFTIEGSPFKAEIIVHFNTWNHFLVPDGAVGTDAIHDQWEKDNKRWHSDRHMTKTNSLPGLAEQTPAPVGMVRIPWSWIENSSPISTGARCVPQRIWTYLYNHLIQPQKTEPNLNTLHLLSDTFDFCGCLIKQKFCHVFAVRAQTMVNSFRSHWGITSRFKPWPKLTNDHCLMCWNKQMGNPQWFWKFNSELQVWTHWDVHPAKRQKQSCNDSHHGKIYKNHLGSIKTRR